jgi:hypothetical protein
MNSYHIVSLHLKIVHYWIFCICMHLGHAYHVIFQIKIIWIWKMFIHICGMFDLQLTNAYRLKHYLINSTVSYFLRWSLILAWIYLVYMSYTEEVRWPPSSLVFCVHLVLQFTREACTLYFLFLFGIYIYNCYSLRLSGPKPWLEIKFVHYLIKHQSQGGLAPGHWICPTDFFFTVNVLPTFTIFKWAIHWR